MPFLLACRVSVEKSADSLIGVPLYICLFSLVSFNILSVFNFCQFDYFVFWCAPPWAHPSWDTLCFLNLTISFPMFGKFSAFISSNIFSGPFLSSPSGTPIMRTLVCVVSQRYHRLSSFLFIVFSIFCSVIVISTILSSRSCIYSSDSVILLLIPSSIVFICLFVL